MNTIHTLFEASRDGLLASLRNRMSGLLLDHPTGLNVSAQKGDSHTLSDAWYILITGAELYVRHSALIHPLFRYRLAVACSKPANLKLGECGLYLVVCYDRFSGQHSLKIS